MPFAEIPPLRNMVLTGEDDGDMSYMRMQERQLKPGASSRALPPSHGQQPPDDPHDDSATACPSRGHGRYSQPSDDQQDHRNHPDRGIPRHANSRNGESERQGKRGGFRPTYD